MQRSLIPQNSGCNPAGTVLSLPCVVLRDIEIAESLRLGSLHSASSLYQTWRKPDTDVETGQTTSDVAAEVTVEAETIPARGSASCLPV
ncbi:MULTISPECIES: hypothetical protein [unclassified Bradyrhizobium]|uniref:hypothetical protein n=1 Tax=unclassified Bradyrhizobium TaxID=2631580 RepID=UPI002FF05ABA